ncbi:cytochrome C [Chryseobacterium indologenes]|uniref:Cytochrome C n=1 Tax=Chryseobacterium indologenes TaxID=253 RepID=A0AAD0YXA3_CHRID|nr:c-type cytochrome [Chryseobacterium indologenes]AYZ37997.1 cytochrome C [Chryseobacterium indologenes]AZB18787.1 cytochrome C [Chryseobacterium indologenes]MBF6646920.1 c-type cytochrome [Chryseobacterium indologenes]MBU3047057.1 c-type cytochrome [Chryseobacterium indologenes]MEB4761251.1 c-type cytochrome [Chryseobacterium indologenes]
MKKTILIGIAVSAFLLSCGPTSTAVTGPKYTSSEKLAQGKTIFENSCAKCHQLPEPTKHDNQGWIKTLSRMAPKAKLNDDQHQMVYDYLISVNKK